MKTKQLIEKLLELDDGSRDVYVGDGWMNHEAIDVWVETVDGVEVVLIEGYVPKNG